MIATRTQEEVNNKAAAGSRAEVGRIKANNRRRVADRRSHRADSPAAENLAADQGRLAARTVNVVRAGASRSCPSYPALHHPGGGDARMDIGGHRRRRAVLQLIERLRACRLRGPRQAAVVKRANLVRQEPVTRQSQIAGVRDDFRNWLTSTFALRATVACQP